MDVRFAFCFPDTYEVGMSFLGEKILYELLNSHENWWCERAFMPWLDMKAEMERLDLPLYTMESKDPLTDFDAVGFTLQYEAFLYQHSGNARSGAHSVLRKGPRRALAPDRGGRPLRLQLGAHCRFL